MKVVAHHVLSTAQNVKIGIEHAFNAMLVSTLIPEMVAALQVPF